MTNIITAVKKADVLEVKEILIQNPKDINEEDENGIAPQFLAAATGCLPLVRYVVEYTVASMNTKDGLGRSVLHYGVESGNLFVVKYLVEKVGMNPLEGDKQGVTPFELAHNLKIKEIETYFEKRIGCAYEDMYQNPIRRGAFADPSIVRVGEDYYMVNSSFTYFPCIPISHSKDLIHWHIIGHAITQEKYANLDELESGRGYWAPDISYCEGMYYITATYRLNDGGKIYRRQMIVSSKNPEGPYSPPIYIDEDGIDPSLFQDEDGKRYMLLNRGARILELNESATKQIGEAKLLWYGDHKRAPEGPHLLKKDRYYYLFLAEGGTGMGHRISVARAKSLEGPYESCPYNPIMRQQDEGACIQRAGHGKPVMTQNGDWYMVYLCARPFKGKYTLLGRETAIDPITWTMDGWPIVNELKGPSNLQRKPNLPTDVVEENKNLIFVEDKLNVNWVWVRGIGNHAYEKIKKREQEGIRLYGSQYPLSDKRARNIMLQRQEKFIVTIESAFDYHLPITGQETGLTCYYDENTYLTFGIKKEELGYCIIVTERIGQNTRIPFRRYLAKEQEQKEIKLIIKTNYLERSFWYQIDNEELFLGKLSDVNYLCDEGYDKGKRFTGAMAGIYAFAGEKEKAWGEFYHIKLDAKE